MAFLGKIIKGAIHLGHTFIHGNTDPIQVQEKELRNLLSKAKETVFGEYFNFEKILKSQNLRKEFAQKVPIYDYEKIYSEWWHRTHNEEPNVTWPGVVKYFALSSGTTGNQSKRIPVTPDMLQSIRMAGIQQVLHLDKFNLPDEFFEKDILMLGSSTSLINQNNHWEGEISGISAGNIPFWFDSFYKPGKEIAGINDWDEKVRQIVLQAPNWDVGAIAGIPAWVQLMIENILEYHQLQNIHEIWPDFSVFASGGVAFEPYRKNFERLTGKPIQIIDTYLASEGFIAFQSRPESNDMSLILNNSIYYEFIPFTTDNFNGNGDLVEHPEVLTIEQVEENKDYALLITTCAGAWRYMIGDTIKFTNLKHHEISITGRTKQFMNVAGSQLSVEKMNAAMEMLQDKFNIAITEFVIAAVPYQGGFAHKWYIGTNDQVNAETLTHELDSYLQEVNKNYKVARSKALKAVFAETILPDLFIQWQAEYKKLGGQTKTPRVMREEQFNQFEEFIVSHPTGISYKN